MTLRVVGAGVGRTGTHSLKVGLEKLLGGPCYHMIEVFPRPDHPAKWLAAMNGEDVDYDDLLDGFVAAVDWPACTMWRELADANPDAIILLSTRDPESWWTSCENTIFEAMRGPLQGAPNDWTNMAKKMLELFDGDMDDKDRTIAVPDEPFPHVNTTEEFRQMMLGEQPASS
jgi:Sulfotransferase domain